MLGELFLIGALVYFRRLVLKIAQFIFMGVGASVHDRLLDAVNRQDWQAIEKCCQDGANLEYKDKKERTPLMIACTMEEGYHVVSTLLRLGARVDAYKRGPSGGFPIHFAARKGLYLTVRRLLEANASANVLNDDGHTPLSLAREKGHWRVVRAIEERVAVFKGHIKGLSVPSGLMGYIPSGLLSRLWYAVVMPSQQDPRFPPAFELMLFATDKNADPKIQIPLTDASAKLAKEDTPDPILFLSDSSGNKKFKFIASKDTPGGDAVVKHLYDVCCRCGIRIPDANPPPLAQMRPANEGSPPPNAEPSLAMPQPPNTDPCPPMPSTHDIGSAQPEAPSRYPPPVYPPPPPPHSPPPLPPRDASSMPEGFRLFPSEHEPAGPCYPPFAHGYPMADPYCNRVGGVENPSFSAAAGEVPASSDHRQWLPEPEGEFNGWGPARSWNEAAVGATTSSMENDEGRRWNEAALNLNGWEEVLVDTDWDDAPCAVAQNGGGREELHFQHRPHPLENEGDFASQRTDSTAPSAPPLPYDESINNWRDNILVDDSPTPSRTQSKESSGASKSDGICPICMDEPANAVCVPCGHVAGCISCLSDVKSRKMGCPVCRAVIREVVKMYKV